MKDFEEIKNYLENLNDYELVAIWNDYCDKNNYYDNKIYNTDNDFDWLFENESPTKIAESVCFGNFNANDNYFIFDGYGNLKSGYALELIYVDELARYIAENEEYFDNDELYDFCNEEEE